MHVVQLTPRGSGCSIVFGDLPSQREMAPGRSAACNSSSPTAKAARQELIDRGVESQRDHGVLARRRRHVLRLQRSRRQHVGSPAAQGSAARATDPRGPPGPLRRLERGSHGWFHLRPAITARFRAIEGGVIHAVGLANGPSRDDLVEAFAAEQAAALARIGSTPLSELPSLAAWRRAFRAFGVDPTAYRSAAEALLRRLTKQGSIPSINALVDIGNLVSIRYALPVAVFDQRAMTGGTTVRFATGAETFTDLGSGERESPEARRGDLRRRGGPRLRPGAGAGADRGTESASEPATTEILVSRRGPPRRVPADDIAAAALADLEALLSGRARSEAMGSGIVNAAQPTFAGR